MSKSPLLVETLKLLTNYARLNFVGLELRLFNLSEDLFHKFATRFDEEEQREVFKGLEKAVEDPGQDRKSLEVLVKWIHGQKEGLYKDQGDPFYDIDTPVHELTSFKLSLLATELCIAELAQEALVKLDECLKGGAWLVTVEAVKLAYPVSPLAHWICNTIAVQWSLIFGAMEELFAGGEFGEGSQWKTAVTTNESFNSDV
jgi:hypothetical protein